MMEKEEEDTPTLPFHLLSTLAEQTEKALCNQIESYSKAEFTVKVFNIYIFKTS